MFFFHAGGVLRGSAVAASSRCYPMTLCGLADTYSQVVYAVTRDSGLLSVRVGGGCGASSRGHDN